MSARSLLARVTRLEAARVSPWARFFGTPEQFATDVQRGVVEGRYDRRDMVGVVAAVQRWMSDEVWR